MPAFAFPYRHYNILQSLRNNTPYKIIYEQFYTHSHEVLTIKRIYGLPIGKKLTTEQVNEIKQSNEIRKVLAVRYGVSVSTVQKIKENRY